MPQYFILQSGEHLVPKFIGRMEHISEHWGILRKRLLRRGIRIAKSLPEKNVRRIGRNSLRSYFHKPDIIEKFLQIYGQDVKLFYSDASIDDLITNSPLKAIKPLKSLDKNTKTQGKQ